jgi:hypothetical protein
MNMELRPEMTTGRGTMAPGHFKTGTGNCLPASKMAGNVLVTSFSGTRLSLRSKTTSSHRPSALLPGSLAWPKPR